MSGPHQNQPVATAGKPVAEARAAMILVHGRGASAQNILELADLLHHPDLAYLAPQASGGTWYPYSFLAPVAHNEPGLSSGLQRVAELVSEVEAAGIPAERIIVGGFSQGACLAAELVARNPRRYGGLLLFSGGLIGPPDSIGPYEGDLAGTPAFLGCSDVDFHIPLERVQETTAVLRQMGAEVDERIYTGMGHTIVQDEIEHAMQIVTRVMARVES